VDTRTLAHNGSLHSEMLSDFRKEPSPYGRGGKMLEETYIDYSLSVCWRRIIEKRRRECIQGLSKRDKPLGKLSSFREFSERKKFSECKKKKEDAKP
jgi:hypothetical protein